MGSAAPVGGMVAQVEGYVWMRRWRLAAAGGYLSMSCVELRGARGGINFCSLDGKNLVIAGARDINFLPRSSHDIVVVLISYVHLATKKVGYKI